MRRTFAFFGCLFGIPFGCLFGHFLLAAFLAFFWLAALWLRTTTTNPTNTNARLHPLAKMAHSFGAAQAVLHDLRYQIDCLLVEYRLRYYSTSKNPRVIQQRLCNQQLLSLRTWPHDKYFLKTGEFLAMSFSRATNADRVAEDPLSAEQQVLFTGFDEDHECPQCGRLGHSAEPNNGQIEAESAEDVLVDLNVAPESPKKSFRRFMCLPFTKRVRSVAPLAEEDEEEEDEETAAKTKKGQMAKPSENTKKAEAPGEVEAPARAERTDTLPLKDLLLGLKTLHLQPANARGEVSEQASQNTPGRHEKVWTSVLNGVSLQAARISTGSQPTSRGDRGSVTADFIGAKSDFFAARLQEAKFKYHGEPTVACENVIVGADRPVLVDVYDGLFTMYGYLTVERLAEYGKENRT